MFFLRPRHLFCLLLVAALPFIACNGHRTGPPKVAAQPQPGPAGQLKIIRAPGADSYASVCRSMRDKAGNLWFAVSGDGVYRYDGQRFRHFTIRDGLSSNTICSMLEDTTGALWFGTDAGVICRYDGQRFIYFPVSAASGSYSFMANVTENRPHQPNRVNCLLQDKSGTVWAGTNEGVYRYNGTFFSCFLPDKNVVNKRSLRLICVQSILEDRAGTIWFATWFEGVCRYNGQELVSFRPNGEVWFNTLLEDRQGTIWVGRRGSGVCRYDGKTFANVRQQGVFDSCGINALLEDRQGNIWFATEADALTDREKLGGLWRYDGRVFHNFTTKDGLPHNSVWCVVEDRAGNIWAGTRNSGLCRYNGESFTRFSE